MTSEIIDTTSPHVSITRVPNEIWRRICTHQIYSSARRHARACSFPPACVFGRHNCSHFAKRSICHILRVGTGDPKTGPKNWNSNSAEISVQRTYLQSWYIILRLVVEKLSCRQTHTQRFCRKHTPRVIMLYAAGELFPLQSRASPLPKLGWTCPPRHSC